MLAVFISKYMPARMSSSVCLLSSISLSGPLDTVINISLSFQKIVGLVRARC